MEGIKRVEVIESKSCSTLRVDFTPSRRGGCSLEPVSPATSSGRSEPPARSDGPFSGLVICVTGLSKEARKQVMEATEKLGGEYSPNLHSRCTHLIVQSCDGRKFEHGLKHGTTEGLHIVTLGWFVDSVRGNVRLCESLYTVKSLGETEMRMDERHQLVSLGAARKSCIPVEKTRRRFQGANSTRSKDLALSGYSIYVDPDTSDEVRDKVSEIVVHEGAKLITRWFVGCNASHVVCEGDSVRRYLGHTSNLVTPFWILKTVEEKHTQRLVQISADLARHVGIMLENLENSRGRKESNRGFVPEDAPRLTKRMTSEDMQKIVESAKKGVRNRRVHRTKTGKILIQPITPSILLDSICWTISEPTSTASIYTQRFSGKDVARNGAPAFFDAKTDASFTNFTALLTESERGELVHKNHFLTILFPIDRYGEMGPSARTYFSDTGFTCLQVLDHIYTFYQENMSEEEIEAAIHTDSRHGDRLRAAYCHGDAVEGHPTVFKRIEFLGCRKNFEMLKRVKGDNYSNVYELVIKA